MVQSSTARPTTPRKRGQAGKPDLGLFSMGGPFAGYAGPALVTGPNGVVLAANAAGEDLACLIKTKLPDELRTAIETALAGRTAQVTPLPLPAKGDAHRPRVVEVTALPWGDGVAALLLGRDVTLERHLRQATAEAHARYKDMVGLLRGDFAWETDGEGRFVFVSPGGALDHAAAALLHTSACDLAEGGDGKSVFLAHEPVAGAALRLRRADGTTAEVRAEALPVLGEDSGWRGARGLCRDVTAEQAGIRRLHRAGQRERVLTAILRVSRDNPDPTTTLETVADGLLPALGVDGAAVYRSIDGGFRLATAAGDVPPPAALEPLLARLEAGAGEAEAGDAETSALALVTRDGDTINGALCLWHAGRDQPWSADERALSAELAAQLGQAIRRIAREEELTRLSEMDPLTGLPNRRALLAALERHLAAAAERDAKQPARRAALLYLDLDDFKLVNDNRGHPAGDDTLTGFARLLRGHARHGDIAARLGGDEFALFLEDIPEGAAIRRAETLANACAAALGGDTGDPSRPLGVSVGVAMIAARQSESVSDLLRRADDAMYRAKQAGKGGVVLAPPAEAQAEEDADRRRS